ncbi:MAG: zinc-ribbon domain-containing protein [Desulfarculus sp.]|nr:zinc-ribbon domain-containing protein [Desulfarculus sp.]
MIVQCESCQTKFKLDDSRLTSEGAWVRCSRCQEVFQVLPPNPEQPAPPQPNGKSQDTFELSVEPGQAAAAEADFGLDVDAMTRRDDRAKGGKGIKLLFWLVFLPIILILVLVGGLLVLDRMHLLPQVVNPFRNLPGFSLFLSRPATKPGPTGLPGGKSETAAKSPVQAEYRGLRLNQVRAYYRMNQKSGRLFVIQGQVQNEGDQTRIRVMVRGQLNDTQGKAAAQVMVYAGQVFTTEELQELPYEEIKAKLEQPPLLQGQPQPLTAGGNAPFMIVFANLPSNLAEYAADVVGSEPAPAEGAAR